ncbi:MULTISPECIES: RNA-guided endonuclease TnpB family protein [unclassified Pseudofrankia]|uniref:RNA-guided endonuclease InsQ/TnpB family protein n=1 Tax=unclassified Pseudofrankia TaxID=2994372 RepID=UPI0009F651C4|nr:MULTISPECIES: RNA-guided endonuclease TnpB family protein [unclassified Pseudofrankia]MDT3443356.1 transposase [Pseudofrankia sp. BMG5.37]
MCRFRLYPTADQVAGLEKHCAHARYVWNLAMEQQSWWRAGRGPAPGFNEQCRQLTEARRENPWLAAGSHTVQQQALRDFAAAMAAFFRGGHGKPGFRRRGRSEGFRVVGSRPRQWDVQILSRNWAQLRVPKVGWVRLRRSRPVPEARSYRVTRDRAGRWHVSFAAIPEPVPEPGSGRVVGVDRGVAVSAALSTGELWQCPSLRPKQSERLDRLQRRLAKAKPGSRRRDRLKSQIARLRARETDQRKDWVEKSSTDLVRRFDLIRVEDLRIRQMTRSCKGSSDAPGRNVRAKSRLNRAILAQGWGMLARRLREKAPSRVEEINSAFTSQTCSACGIVDREARESQAVFRCRVCAYTGNADVNAARNIARGHRVTARGGGPVGQPVNREPQRTAPPFVTVA